MFACKNAVVHQVAGLQQVAIARLVTDNLQVQVMHHQHMTGVCLLSLQEVFKGARMRK